MNVLSLHSEKETIDNLWNQALRCEIYVVKIRGNDNILRKNKYDYLQFLTSYHILYTYTIYPSILMGKYTLYIFYLVL